MSRLRLGLPVIVRTDGKKDAVLDWEAMCEAWGIPHMMAAQRSLRKAPDDGIIDTALDTRVQSRLKKWPRSTAVLTGFERCTAFGMTTDNWDVHLRLSDGQMVTSGKDNVPFYAHWLAVPGAEVPVAVEGDRAVVDWPAAALAVPGPVDFEATPPPGSIAEQRPA
jgi:hypothetical protein